MSGKKIYYKLSNYDSEKGIIGHECVNEIIVDRLLSILGVEHLEYQLIHADIEIDEKYMIPIFVHPAISKYVAKQKQRWIIIIRSISPGVNRIMNSAREMVGRITSIPC